MKKKACPVGLICIETKYLIIILSMFILILLYFLVHKPLPLPIPAPAPEIYKSKDKVKCSEKKFNKSNNYVEKTNSLRVNNNHINDVKNNDYDFNESDDNNNSNNKIVIQVETPQTQHTHLINKDHERIINPLLPPERRNHYIDKSAYEVAHGVPINIPTRGYTGGAMQIGALYKQETSDEDSKIGQNTEPVIIPLFGNPTYNGSNKWMYYTSTDKFNQVKLPISNKNKQCNSEYGCDELYDGDIVQVPAYNGDFKVVKYEYDKPRYIPNIY